MASPMTAAETPSGASDAKLVKPSKLVADESKETV